MPLRERDSLRGSALLICLAFVVLMTLLVITFLVMARTEGATSRLAMDRVQAELLADLAADTAMERLRETIDAGRTFNSSRYTTWASEPGRIHVFTVTQGSGDVSLSSYDMFSAMPGPDNATTPNLNNIDLNALQLSGLRPITGTVEGTMKVGWKNVLSDPGAAASASNPITGRIAYWVDDESCKVNVNTADGSHKNDSPAMQNAAKKYSYGFGTPSEISLLAFPDMTKAVAEGIASYAATRGFNSVTEVGQVTGLPSDFLAKNRFSLTYSSRSPDINMFGEPRIHLFPVNRLVAAPNRSYNLMVGPYGGNNTLSPATEAAGASDVSKLNCSGVLDHIYPTQKQLPFFKVYNATAELPQSALNLNDTRFTTSSVNYPMGLRIAKYLQGFNSQGDAITWPKIDGFGGGFVGKYSLRQIDSIVLQMLDLCGKCVMADQLRAYTLPAYMMNGFLSNEMVTGVGRSPKLNELVVIAAIATGSTPQVQLEMRYEFFFPRFYGGIPLDFGAGSICQWVSSFNPGGVIGANMADLPVSPLGQFRWWHCNQLRLLDGTGQPAGVDLYNTPSGIDDPDQPNAAIYHPYSLSGSTYKGSNLLSTTTAYPILAYVGGPYSTGDTGGGIGGVLPCYPGFYSVAKNRHARNAVRTRQGLTELKIEGGVSYTSHYESDGYTPFEVVPMEALRLPYASYSNESPASIPNVVLGNVIPISLSLGVPGTATTSIRVADPLVNKFPGDWVPHVGSSPSDAGATTQTPNSGNGNTRGYNKGAMTVRDPDFPLIYPPPTPFGGRRMDLDVAAIDGDNPEYKPSGGGDPLSVWLPLQDIRIPKQARLPSLGALNNLRTGMIPDTMNSNPILNKGIPWRSICFDAATGPGQKTDKGAYPDWMILDLFTIPFLPQEPDPLINRDTPTANPKPLRQLTSGGSTEGRLNINNPRVPYPFAESVPGVIQSGPERLAPLQALFKDVQASNSYTGDDPVYATANALGLTNAVQAYLASKGPFMVPGQLANVPDIAAFTYRGVPLAAQSRNDLFRKIIGATTTQSNTFSIWVVSQTIKKAIYNTNYGTYEPGDVITGEVRRRYLVERLIEPGKDGVPGNIKKVSATVTTTSDGVLNTLDDTIDADYHPAMTYPLPYRWRIIMTEDVTH